MDEFDFMESLASIRTRKTGKAKTAAMRDSVKATMKGVKEWLKTQGKDVAALAKANKPEILGGAVGGGVVAAGSHASHKKNKKTGKSAQQSVSESAVKALGPKKKSDSFGKGVARVGAKSSKEYNDLASKHPRSAALSEAALIGVPLGGYVARKLAKR